MGRQGCGFIELAAVAMKVLLGLFVASALLLGTSQASPYLGETSDTVVEEADWSTAPTTVFTQENAPTAGAKPIFAMTCVQRKQEALRTLMNLNAAKTLKQAAVEFSVQDTKAEWRVQQWHTRYIKAATNYAFFCEQTPSQNLKVSKTIRIKEGAEAQKAALRGLQDATYLKREKTTKARLKVKESKSKKDEAAHEEKQKKLIQLMADKARLERLRSYPQSSNDLLGFVVDASSGKGIAGVDVTSKCPFDEYETSTKAAENGFSKYEVVKGVTGPRGYRCYLTFNKAGYISLRFRVLISRHNTQAIFRQATLMPHLKSPPKYRIVMQYGTQMHTIHALQEGSYGYYIKNYDYHYTNNLIFSHSDARVFVYEGNKLKHRFGIRNAQGNPERIWQVFNIKCKKVQGELGCEVHPVGAFVHDMPTSPDVAAQKH